MKLRCSVSCRATVCDVLRPPSDVIARWRTVVLSTVVPKRAASCVPFEASVQRLGARDHRTASQSLRERQGHPARAFNAFNVSLDFLLLDDVPRRPLEPIMSRLAQHIVAIEGLSDEDEHSLLHLLDAIEAKNKLKAVAAEVGYPDGGARHNSLALNALSARSLWERGDDILELTPCRGKEGLVGSKLEGDRSATPNLLTQRTGHRRTTSLVQLDVQV